MAYLRKLGKIWNISKSGFIVVQADPSSLPKVGSSVVDRKMKKIGYVYDIIGPVKNPFVLVKPDEDVLKEMIFGELFVVEAYGGGGEGGRKEGGRKRGRKKRS